MEATDERRIVFDCRVTVKLTFIGLKCRLFGLFGNSKTTLLFYHFNDFVILIFRSYCPFVDNCKKKISADSEYPSMDSKLGLEAPIS